MDRLNGFNELHGGDDLVDKKAFYSGLVIGVGEPGDVGDHLREPASVKDEFIDGACQFIGGPFKNRGMKGPGQGELTEHGPFLGEELAEPVDGPFEAGDGRLLGAVLVGDVDVTDTGLRDECGGIGGVLKEHEDTARSV